MSILINFAFAVLPFTLLDTVPPPIAIAKEEPTQIFEVVEEMPRFPGCEDIKGDEAHKKQCADQKMMQWFFSNVRIPAQADRQLILGPIIICFVIQTDGRPTDFQIKKSIGELHCDTSILNTFKEMPNFIPAQHFGETVACKMCLPIRIHLK